MLTANRLNKAYGDFVALKSLDLDIARGEIYCLLGANGAGKSTTLNLFLGFIEPTGGEARIDGLSVSDEPQQTKKYVAYIPDHVALYAKLTGLENLSYFCAIAGIRDLDQQALMASLDRVGLTVQQAEKRVETYSKGMRQKVGIAIAVARQAPVLLLDEPTTGLDPKSANEFSDLLKELSNDGACILMATHDLFHAKSTGTRVGILRHGQLLAELATGDITHDELQAIYLEHMSS